MIDTGSDDNFIDPKHTQNSILIPTKQEITTALNKHLITNKIKVDHLNELNNYEPLEFLVFKFHHVFDGIIGNQTLRKLNNQINYSNDSIIFNNVRNKIYYKPCIKTPVYTLEPFEQKLITLPIDKKQNDVYIPKTVINDHIQTIGGIYQAKDYHTKICIQNNSDKQQKFLLSQPLKADILTNYHEFNNINNANPPNDLDYSDSYEFITNNIRMKHLNQEEQKHLTNVCIDFRDIFYEPHLNMTFTSDVKHTITTKDDIPIFTKSYRYPQCHKEEVKRQIDELLEKGIIRPSNSPWSSPIWIVPKKADASGKKKWRLVVDYRKLNEKTIDDRYPLPNISDILDKLGNCKYFSTLDLASGFHQIEMHPKDIPKTAFSVDHGHYEYSRMTFGLKNAPATFQRVMDNMLREHIGKNVLVYMDDIIIFSSSLQEHIETLRKVFTKLREHNFKTQLDKCEFLHKEIEFLGHIVTTEGIKPNPKKIEVIKNFPIPKTVTEIKSFLGLLGYYRKFIKDFSKITKPLTQCLQKDQRIDINNTEYKRCFEYCKTLLTHDPILQYPDFTKPFVLTTDASNYAIGGVLSQGNIGSDKPICYASGTLTKSEQNYSTIEKAPCYSMGNQTIQALSIWYKVHHSNGSQTFDLVILSKRTKLQTSPLEVKTRGIRLYDPLQKRKTKHQRRRSE